MINENSKIEFHHLRFSTHADDHKLYGVVRLDTNDSLMVDKDVMAMIQFLKLGHTVNASAKIIHFSTTVVITVLHMLENAHFIKSIDKVLLDDQTEKIKPWFVSVNRKWFKWFLSKPFVTFISIFSVLGVILGLFMNGIPSYKSFFWTSDIFVVFYSLFFINIILTLFHESCHFIATKAVGGEAVMRINYRYIFIVAETESYYLAIIPKKFHYYVYFAGPIYDLFNIAFIYLFIAFTKIYHIDIGLLYNFLIAVVLTEFIGIIWEFNVFLETDMYNFMSEYFGIENLRIDALRYMTLHVEKWKKVFFYPAKKLLLFIAGNRTNESDDLRFLNKSDRQKLLIYIVILIGGLTFITLQYIFYTIPLDITFIYDSVIDGVNAVQTHNFTSLIKSIMIIIMVFYEYLLLFYMKVKSEKKLRKYHHS